MATISISGTNKLAERIIADAEEEARTMRGESAASEREIRQQSDKAVSARRSELENQREAAKSSLLGGYQTRASLDGKKDALRKKRAIIDDAFSGAYDALLSLDAQKRKSICARMLEAEAEGGEIVLPAGSDRIVLEALIAAMPQKRLTLSAENAKIDGGFILRGEGYEKDCSFRALMQIVRDAEETAVYKLLFD